ncbi:hypothetical protein DXG03_007925 [Asterophora parasitica]|uniref:Major facilitator superfamily (MFS) profile domain-containing protein n=1 Tax=Asterophora parasitica TaxID=117018 RepID=A0A9P7G616_9AGAR|nr:hypothetical protein DXG03_007925 [Asterophora parasitica]
MTVDASCEPELTRNDEKLQEESLSEDSQSAPERKLEEEKLAFRSLAIISFHVVQMAYWFGFAAVAGAFGGLLAFSIQHIDAHIQNWRLLFLIEGSPAVLLGFLAMFLLPDRPESTTFLTERERDIALERMNRATSSDTGAVVNPGASFGNGPVFKD